MADPFPYFLINQKKVLVISMAITKIHPIKSTLNLEIGYITKSEKTDKKNFSIIIQMSSIYCTYSIYENTRRQ